MSESPQLQPYNEFNRELESQVHPPGWRNPKPGGRYNLVIIGGGAAGLITAAGAAGLGAKVALVERSLLGGDCLNAGCVPSKGIICSSRVAAAIRDGGEFGIRVPDGASVDFGATMDRMRKLRARISHHDSAARFKELGVDVFLGAGSFVDGETIEVEGEKLLFKRAVVATGARATIPLIPGLDEVSYLTNETMFSLTEIPRRFGIIGGGPLGCEMAQTFARLGSEVFLLDVADRILPREDPDAAAIVDAVLRSDGTMIFCRGKELKLSPADGGRIRFQVDSEGPQDEVVDQLLVAVGRTPNLEGMSLEAAGVEFTGKGVTVNERLQTSNPRIYAAGDICSPYQFTHAADSMARIVIQNALFFGRAKASTLTIPWCTYTEPEVAHVGLYECDAREKGIEIDTFTQEMNGVDRAMLEGKPDGFVRVHVKRGSDEILGATIVAAHAGDMISELTLAMVNKIGLKKVASVIHPYPTQAEAIRKVGDLYNRARFTPTIAGITAKWLQWLR